MDRYKGSNQKQSIKAYKELLILLEENGHELKSDYKNAKEKILIDFKCGHEPHWINSNKYKSGRGCPYCKKRGKEQAIESLNELLKENNHTLLSEYKGAKEKVLIDFNCGHEPKWVTPTHYKGGHYCSECASNNQEKAIRELKELVEKNNHKLLSKYKGTHEKVLIDFNCGHEPNWITPSHYKNGRRCPSCMDKSQIYSKKVFEDCLKERGHIALTEYETNDRKVLIDFKCKHEPHWITPSSYKSGQGCPKCRTSKAVLSILDYLSKINVEYQTELRLKNNRYYDIYIEEFNLIIEVHGEQHYKDIKFFKRTLEEEQENDIQKERYAIEQGFNYMVISYKENIPELALERFKKEFNKYINN